LDNSDSEIWQQIFAMNERNLEKFYLEFFENLEKNIKQPLNDGLRPLLGDLIFGEKKFDEKFFEENFVAIFFRVLVVLSYLQIPEVKTHQNYAGSGFRDFTSIIKILNYDEKKLTSLIQKNQQKIRKFFNSIN
jgi:hypothetical protein